MNDPQSTPKFRGRREFMVSLLALGAAACAGGASEANDGLPQSSEFLNLDGSTGTLADYSGKPTVLNFFASWCPPCRAELPEFETVSREVAPDIQFLGVSTDFQQNAWLQLVEETGLTFPTVFQPSNELYTASKSPAMPTTVFIGADGGVRHTFAGRLSEDALRDLITEHLA